MVLAAEALSLGELLGRDVHAHGGSRWTRLHGGGEDVHARPAAKVEHALAGDQVGETEVVADARERAHRLGRQSVEEVGRVAERFGKRPSGVEVQVAPGPVCHVAIHRGDVVGELIGVDAGNGGHRVVPCLS